MEEKYKKFGEYSEVLTDDGSTTLWSKAFDENCHSTFGAKTETLEIYIKGCEIVQKAQTKGSVKVLEVGLGAGLGLELTSEILQKEAPDAELHYMALEIDPYLAQRALQKIPHLKNAKKYINSYGEHYLAYHRLHSFALVIGDATRILADAYKDPLFADFFPVNAIYQDAFSPKKNPELWTRDWFMALKEVASADVILSTYSSSGAAKRAMTEADWFPKEHPGFSIKKSSTRAKRNA